MGYQPKKDTDKVIAKTLDLYVEGADLQRVKFPTSININSINELNEIEQRTRAALQYTAFDNSEQNNEFEIMVVSDAIYFISILPTAFIIDESFYNILNVALTPTVTMISPR